MPTMQKIFPEFEWKFWDLDPDNLDLNREELLGRIVQESDYFWNVDHDYWVTARRCGESGEPWRTFGSIAFPGAKGLQWDDDTPILYVIKSLGGTPCPSDRDLFDSDGEPQ